MSISEQNFDHVWNEYFPKVFGYFYRRVNSREDVEDLTSVVMAAFIQKISQEELQNPRGYLWQIAHNQLNNFIRNKSKRPVTVDFTEEDLQIEEKLENTYSDSYVFRTEELVKCAKKSLRPEEYNLIEKTVMGEEKAVDVAISQDMNPATVRKRVSRALKKLREKCRSLWESYHN
jgi:RNA polymerase sigma factor (sigma-70 family)